MWSASTTCRRALACNSSVLFASRMTTRQLAALLHTSTSHTAPITSSSSSPSTSSLHTSLSTANSTSSRLLHTTTPSNGTVEGEVKSSSSSAAPEAPAASSVSTPVYPNASRGADPTIVDLYPPEKIDALSKKYDWVDFNRLAKHLHMTDVHFFDQEVPWIDQDFVVKPDFGLLHRLEGVNRLKRLQEAEDAKVFRLLDFGYWVTEGRNVRITSEGKVASMWSMVIAGDRNGTASFGIGKGDDMMTAERRALQDLRRNMMFVPLFESRTISHEVIGRHGVCKVRMWPRNRERGMTAGIIPRMIFECFGVRDITAKVIGRAIPKHQVLACFEGLSRVKSLREEAMQRGLTPYRMHDRGVDKPRYPTREELDRRGEQVTSMLREARARILYEKDFKDLGFQESKSGFYYPEETETAAKQFTPFHAGQDLYVSNSVLPPARKSAPHTANLQKK